MNGGTSSTDAVPAVIASRYRVLRELGRGGMGVVYVVEHVHTGDHLALKLLLGRAAFDAQAVERFKREARASARIKSEHVVRVLDADVAPELAGAPFLVMELLDGADLQKNVERRGALPPEEVVGHLAQAARALDKSHAIGIVHRDLKPENIFVHRREDGSGLVKILDFGISKVVGADAGNDIAGAGVTKSGAVMGTPLYMAPEQARGRVAEIGPATDVWAMGLIAVRLLTGEIYWTADTLAELLLQIVSEPMYPPTQRWPALPPGIDAWFARSCARDPIHRFASVGEQIESLRVALGLGAAHAPRHADPTARAALPAAPPPASAVVGSQTTARALARSASTTAARPAALGRVAALGLLVATLGSLTVVGGLRAWQLRQAGARSAAQATYFRLPTFSVPTPSASDSATSTPGAPPSPAPVRPTTVNEAQATPRPRAVPPLVVGAPPASAASPAPSASSFRPSGL